MDRQTYSSPEMEILALSIKNRVLEGSFNATNESFTEDDLIL